ncbi:unnamed protein product [Meloidogyne enterolobii]|uniref:Uncharacterized protein n=1 Tax=Meloidogyne enterolobii TaxID=390850 RepID=A0ACB1A165_MELEN
MKIIFFNKNILRLLFVLLFSLNNNLCISYFFIRQFVYLRKAFFMGKINDCHVEENNNIDSNKRATAYKKWHTYLSYNNTILLEISSQSGL